MNYYSTAAKAALSDLSKRLLQCIPKRLTASYDANLSMVEIKLVGLLGSFDLTRVCIFQI